MPGRRRFRFLSSMLLFAGVLLVGCSGKTTSATQVTDSAAKLGAQGSCDTTCTYFFRYGPVSDPAWPSSTPVRSVGGKVSNVSFTESVSGLQPSTTYRYQVCGKEDSYSTTSCAGADGTANTTSSFTTSASTTPAGPITYQGPAYKGTAPTADKPQSKLWRYAGAWWAVMRSQANGNKVNIFKLGTDHVWRDTGTLVDSRTNSTSDALTSGGELYVASRNSTSSPKLARFTFNASTGTYKLDAGFPVTIGNGGSESITIDRDSTGTLWATYTQNSKVWVMHSTTSDATWTAPFNPPATNTTLDPDDISSVVALDGKIGIMWSDQVSEKMYFVTHVDGAPDDQWGSVETALSGSKVADDHINLKTIVGDDGRLYAATKTSLTGATDPLLMLLVRSRDGVWSNYVESRVSEQGTRPILMLDRTNRRIYYFMVSLNRRGTIFYKSTPMDAISFAPGYGDPFLTWPGTNLLSDPTGSKEPVDSTTGMVVLASDNTTFRYYHAEMPIPAAAP